MPMTSHSSTSVTSGASRGTSTVTVRSGYGSDAGHRDPQQQPVGGGRERREVLRAGQPPAVAVGLELRRVDARLRAASAPSRCRPTRAAVRAPRSPRGSARAAPACACREQDAERMRVHLQQLRGGAVDPRERLQHLVVRREALPPTRARGRRTRSGAVSATRPSRRSSAKFSAGKALASSSAAAGACAEGRCERLDRLEPRAAARGSRVCIIGAPLIRRRGAEPEGQQTEPARPASVPTRSPAGGSGRSRQRKRGVRVEERAHLAADDVLPAGRCAARPSASIAPRAHRGAVARARPRARSVAAPGTRASAPGRPSTRIRSASRAASGSSNPPSTSSTPKRPRASAVATGQTRLYCISSVFVGRRRDSRLGRRERADLDRCDRPGRGRDAGEAPHRSPAATSGSTGTA